MDAILTATLLASEPGFASREAEKTRTTSATGDGAVAAAAAAVGGGGGWLAKEASEAFAGTTFSELFSASVLSFLDPHPENQGWGDALAWAAS